jgi:hypothetical protein
MPATIAEGKKMNHPHPSPHHVMVTYRKFLLGTKKRNGSARSLVHYRGLLQEYLAAKRDVLNARPPTPQQPRTPGLKDREPSTLTEAFSLLFGSSIRWSDHAIHR